MPARGKHGKPTSGFPSLPPSLNIPATDETIVASDHLFYFKPEATHYIGIDFDPRPRYRDTMHPMPANVAQPEYLATFSEIRVSSLQGR